MLKKILVNLGLRQHYESLCAHNYTLTTLCQALQSPTPTHLATLCNLLTPPALGLLLYTFGQSSSPQDALAKSVVIKGQLAIE